jgi:hypothetical protein
MKPFIISVSLVMTMSMAAQNIQTLFENLPLPYANCEDAYKSAELEWEQMTLDNDSIFNRAKAWAPGGELKSFSAKLDKLQAYIERASENNGFSLSAPSAIDKAVMNSLDQLTKKREMISKIWNDQRESFNNINSNFIVPNELDNGCDQIASSIQILNSVSGTFKDQLVSFKTKIANDLNDFQTQFDELNKIKHPMVNNQALDEMSTLLNILLEINNGMNFHYKNMVETRMAWNNAFCK